MFTFSDRKLKISSRSQPLVCVFVLKCFITSTLIYIWSLNGRSSNKPNRKITELTLVETIPTKFRNEYALKILTKLSYKHNIALSTCKEFVNLSFCCYFHLFEYVRKLVTVRHDKITCFLILVAYLFISILCYDRSIFIDMYNIFCNTLSKTG